MDGTDSDDLYADPVVTESELENDDLNDESYFTAVSRSPILDDDEDALSPMDSKYLVRSEDETQKKLIAAFEEEEYCDIVMPDGLTLHITDTYQVTSPTNHTVNNIFQIKPSKTNKIITNKLGLRSGNSSRQTKISYISKI